MTVTKLIYEKSVLVTEILTEKTLEVNENEFKLKRLVVAGEQSH